MPLRLLREVPICSASGSAVEDENVASPARVRVPSAGFPGAANAKAEVPNTGALHELEELRGTAVRAARCPRVALGRFRVLFEAAASGICRALCPLRLVGCVVLGLAKTCLKASVKREIKSDTMERGTVRTILTYIIFERFRGKNKRRDLIKAILYFCLI